MVAGTGIEAGSVLQARTKLPEWEAKKEAEWVWKDPLVRLWGKDEKDPREVAFVEPAPPDGMEKYGWRRLTLWADSVRREVLTVVDTESVQGDRAIYRIVDASGARLARVTRDQGSVSSFRRTHWTVAIDGGPTLHAVKGSVFGWCVWWALSPLWAVLALASLLGGDVARMPLKTVFRETDGQRAAALRYTGVLGNDHSYGVEADWPDPRVLFGLAALHNTHLSWRDRP